MGRAQLRPIPGACDRRRQRTRAGNRHRLRTQLAVLYRCRRGACSELIPSPEMLALAERTVASVQRPMVRLLAHSAEHLPLEDDAVFNTVVVTWSLCSIPDPVAALEEMRRVLKPEGQLRFVEHGLSPDTAVRKWQDRLTPLWCHFAGGCHLNRKSDDLVRAAGFGRHKLANKSACGAPNYGLHVRRLRHAIGHRRRPNCKAITLRVKSIGPLGRCTAIGAAIVL